MLISPTDLYYFIECPAKFWYSKRYRALDFADERMLLGRKVHEVIATYYNLIPDNMVPDEVDLYVNKAIEQKLGLFPKEKLLSVLRSFIRFEKQRLMWHIDPKPLAVEQEFKREPFKGIVDAVFKKDGKKVVVDWKTGYVPKTLPDQYLIQGCIYSYLVNAEEVIFYFLLSGSYKQLRAKDCEKVSEKIKTALKQIEEGVNEKRKGSHCKVCPYQIVCRLEEVRWFEWRE